MNEIPRGGGQPLSYEPLLCAERHPPSLRMMLSITPRGALALATVHQAGINRNKTWPLACQDPGRCAGRLTADPKVRLEGGIRRGIFSPVLLVVNLLTKIIRTHAKFKQYRNVQSTSQCLVPFPPGLLQTGVSSVHVFRGSLHILSMLLRGILPSTTH